MRYLFGPRRYSAPKTRSEYVIRVSEDLRRSVVFLGWQKEGPTDEAPIDPCGVGFLVWGEPDKGGGTYLVTAKHVAEKLLPPFVIRFNRKGGGSGLHYIDAPEHIRWVPHPDPTVDLAVASIEFPSWSDNLRYHISSVLSTEPMRLGVGAGTEAHVVGLFHYVHGSKRNLPMVYPARVVALPDDERIPVGKQFVEGYLVQANPISGCSGAPVWAYEAVQVENAEIGAFFYAVGRLFLLGFWSSSWKVKGSEIVAIQADDYDDRKGELAPLGMGVVVPAGKLIDIFRDTDVTKNRAEQHRKEQEANAASPDFREADLPTTDENPTHREDFMRLVGAATRKPEPKD